MLATLGYAAYDNHSPFKLFNFERREPKPNDVLIKILYCGICHSDIHQVKNEWKMTTYPIVPGHEIVGRVEKIGNKVKRYQIGDFVGVGCFVDSCRICENCKNHEEQFCMNQASFTYNSTEQDKKNLTYGGYSNQIVVDENYVLKISDKLPLPNVAPLLCAGITTYSPLKRFNIGPKHKVGVMGLGGLGHMGVKLAASMGAEVTVLSTSANKENDAKKLGAKHFILTKDPKNLEAATESFDFILNTISASHDIEQYLKLLALNGKMVIVGVPPEPLHIHSSVLIRYTRQLSGSLIGGIRETQEMLDFCAENNITADIELISMKEIDIAYKRTIEGEVKYRFVLDLATLEA